MIGELLEVQNNEEYGIQTAGKLRVALLENGIKMKNPLTILHQNRRKKR